MHDFTSLRRQQCPRPARLRACSARGAWPALNDQGYYVGRVERNLYWVTDGVYQSAFLTTPEGVVMFDAPPSIGGNLRRAVDEIAAANGVTNRVTHLVYSHHHDDHSGASLLFGTDVVRIGHEETRRLLLPDNNRARPAPEVTFADRYTLEAGGDRVKLAWHDPNHSPDNIYIHFPDHDTLMFIDRRRTRHRQAGRCHPISGVVGCGPGRSHMMCAGIRVNQYDAARGILKWLPKPFDMEQTGKHDHRGRRTSRCDLEQSG